MSSLTSASGCYPQESTRGNSPQPIIYPPKYPSLQNMHFPVIFGSENCATPHRPEHNQSPGLDTATCGPLIGWLSPEAPGAPAPGRGGVARLSIIMLSRLHPAFPTSLVSPRFFPKYVRPTASPSTTQASPCYTPVPRPYTTRVPPPHTPITGPSLPGSPAVI